MKTELKFETNTINKILKSCKPFIDERSPREVCKVIRLKVEDGMLTVYALDGIKINRMFLKTDNPDCEIGVPLVKTFNKKEPYVIIQEGEKEITFETASGKSIYPKPMQDYPNVEKLFKDDNPKYSFTIGVKSLKDALSGIDAGVVKVDCWDARSMITLSTEDGSQTVGVMPCNPFK